MGILKPFKGCEKKLLENMSNHFCDPNMKDMYGTKEDALDGEDFFPFVAVQMTSPSFLMWDGEAIYGRWE